jgi:universal stress protein F
MYETILIPIDVAHMENVESMLNAARQQGTQECRYVLLNVIEEMPVWVASSFPAGILDESQRASHKELSRLAEAANFNVSIDVRLGHTYRTILAVADEIEADLIVIASHRPGLQDYFLGSVAAKVVRHAKCSVLVMR